MNNIFFKSPEHQTRFIEAMQAIGKLVNDGRFDPEYSAALYILTSGLSMWEKTSGYVTRHGINFDTILEEVDFGGGHTRLVRLAGNLFNGNQHIDPLEFVHLDDGNFKVAITAIKIRCKSLGGEEE